MKYCLLAVVMLSVVNAALGQSLEGRAAYDAAKKVLTRESLPVEAASENINLIKERGKDDGSVRRYASDAPPPVMVLKMTTKLERNRYFPSLSGTWFVLDVQNVVNKPVASILARVEIMDDLHERVHDTVKLQLERQSLFPRHLEPGKHLPFEARLGDYNMPADWDYAKTFGPEWTREHIKVISVTFKDGSTWVP